MIKNRGELIDVTDQVDLTVQFKDNNGNYINTDSFPQISIIQPSGGVLLSSTSIGVTQISIGKYSYIFTVPINGPYGVYVDNWIGYINGFRIESSFNFIVLHTQVPQINPEGFVTLGEDPGFNYDQFAIQNINKLIKSLRARLNSSGKAESKDGYNNTIYVDCDTFSVDMLTTFLATALMDFNQVPYFTAFNFSENFLIEQFGEILVEGATLYALASKALIEKGLEYTVTDNGISFSPPTVAELMTTQYSALLTHYFDKLKIIKNSLRPSPKGLGLFNFSSGMSPIIKKLRHLRERRIL